MARTVEGKEMPCPKCGDYNWEYKDDHDNGDWVEAEYECLSCGHTHYVELAD